MKSLIIGHRGGRKGSHVLTCPAWRNLSTDRPMGVGKDILDFAPKNVKGHFLGGKITQMRKLLNSLYPLSGQVSLNRGVASFLSFTQI